MKIGHKTTLPELIENSEQIYLYGSRVYGTDRLDSDFDYISILKQGLPKTDSILNFGENHYQIYTFDEFLYKIENHDIMALECISLKHSKMVLKKDGNKFDGYFNLNLNKLRESISTICNNSWVKGKKKLIISGDYDKLAALKSIFHSIRIFRFGIQVARQYSITNFQECNWLWIELQKLGEKYDADILWQKIDEKYRSLFNQTSTEFKALAPKDLKVRDKNRELLKVLKDSGTYTPELLKSILEIFEK